MLKHELVPGTTEQQVTRANDPKTEPRRTNGMRWTGVGKMAHAPKLGELTVLTAIENGRRNALRMQLRGM
jgi:hypothetical protein